MKVFAWLGALAPSIEVPRGWSKVVITHPGLSSRCTQCVDSSTALPARYSALLRLLRSKTHGPGSAYVTKLMLPWILPNVTQAVVLDYDLWTSHLSELSDEFYRFSPTQQIGLALDVAWKHLYPNASLGFNGGVQLLHLERMRSGSYESALRTERRRIGYLGDQTMYSYISERHPEMFYRLSCRFNRQLNTHFDLHPSEYSCRDGCDILHGNQPRYKNGIKLANEGSSDVLRRLILPRYQQEFNDCFPRMTGPRRHTQ